MKEQSRLCPTKSRAKPNLIPQTAGTVPCALLKSCSLSNLMLPHLSTEGPKLPTNAVTGRPMYSPPCWARSYRQTGRNLPGEEQQDNCTNVKRLTTCCIFLQPYYILQPYSLYTILCGMTILV